MTVNTDRSLSSLHSIRLYIGNLPQAFDNQELDGLLKSVGEIRFKAVMDRETNCRGLVSPTLTIPKLPTP